MFRVQPADLGQGVRVLIRLDPKTGKCGGYVLVEGFGEYHDLNVLLEATEWEQIAMEVVEA